jgi:hypothetical protein
MYSTNLWLDFRLGWPSFIGGYVEPIDFVVDFSSDPSETPLGWVALETTSGVSDGARTTAPGRCRRPVPARGYGHALRAFVCLSLSSHPIPRCIDGFSYCFVFSSIICRSSA